MRNQGTTDKKHDKTVSISYRSLPLTFLSLFDDLSQGFLQAVGPEHQLLLGPVRFTL